SSGATPAEDVGPAPEQLAEKSEVQPDHFNVVAEIVKMRDAALVLREVAAGRGEVEGGDALPDHAHDDFGIEVEAAGVRRRRERIEQRGGGIHAKAEERVVD